MQVAVAFSVLEFQRQPADASTDSFIWDVSNPSQPEATLSPASPLVCINFNLKDHKASNASASLYWDYSRLMYFRVGSSFLSFSYALECWAIAILQCPSQTFTLAMWHAWQQPAA